MVSIVRIRQSEFVVRYFKTASYVKDWIDNTMVFMEVESVDNYWRDLKALNLPDKYDGVRVSPIKSYDWGKEFFVHDPSGILWHLGEFSKIFSK
ncbi:MAG: hypothetical protein U5N85_04990 [Arcicella sp.]|nr:hypothetical protein [Arcicella sp.]